MTRFQQAHKGAFFQISTCGLLQIVGIERGIFVMYDTWRYDTLKIMEMRAIYTQKMVFQVYISKIQIFFESP